MITVFVLWLWSFTTFFDEKPVVAEDVTRYSKECAVVKDGECLNGVAAWLSSEENRRSFLKTLVYAESLKVPGARCERGQVVAPITYCRVSWAEGTSLGAVTNTFCLTGEQPMMCESWFDEASTVLVMDATTSSGVGWKLAIKR